MKSAKTVALLGGQGSADEGSVVLPRTCWGTTDSDSTALVVHGLGASAATTWRISESLAAEGYAVTAVDLRGHGLAPRTSTYRIQDFAADLRATRPLQKSGSAWNLVVGHSIGAVSSMLAAATEKSWADRLILLDPLLSAEKQLQDRIAAGQRKAHLDATIEDVAAANPSWHALDVELSVDAVKAASLYALEHAMSDNPDWDYFDLVSVALPPTLVIGGDPSRGAVFTTESAQRVQASNPQWQCVSMTDVGHNLHRDRPDELTRIMLDWCAG